MAMTLAEELKGRLRAGLAACGFDEAVLERVGVSQSADLRFGDYQSNAAMVLAKEAKQNPRALAEAVVAKTDVSGLAEMEIAGPGFLNFRVLPEAFAKRVVGLCGDERLGVAQVAEPERIVLDFSAPNVAKPMHVGHIRSTIIGDSLSRIGRFLGHEVITDNHLGDWGTQFGMVVWAWKKELNREALEADPLAELLRLYRLASEGGKADEVIREACREELVKLQQGGAENLAIWTECVGYSLRGLERMYVRLGVEFDHWMGESSYNDRLQGVVDSLSAAGLARESNGALCVFSSGEGKPEEDPFRIQKKEGWDDNPMLVRKSDGGFNYATTDLATIDFRVEEWGAKKILYVVDHRQSLHFRQLFDVAQRRGYDLDLAHVSFGTILGKDGKPLKTRSGDLPQLEDVLNDARDAARVTIEKRSKLDDAAEKDALAELIGISAVKFTELSHHRMSDYVFDLEKMVALEGDTAPYLQYSYVRVRSIFRKVEGEVDLKAVAVQLEADAEVHLARMLVRFGETVPVVLEDYRPNLLATYLLELARAFHSFFEACPVLKAEEGVRNSRLVLCDTTARVLEKGLSLLGIAVPERM
jgi:arginyl-tRNA synthetase